MNIHGLTLKQQKFADEYIICGNATEAYLRAYAKQSRASAEANARKLLGNYSVKSYIEERLKEIESDKIADQTEIMQYLTSVIRGETTQDQLAVVGTGDGASETKIEKLDVPAKDKIKAAELLGKRYSMWTDKQDVNLTVPTFIDDIPEDD